MFSFFLWGRFQTILYLYQMSIITSSRDTESLAPFVSKWHHACKGREPLISPVLRPNTTFLWSSSATIKTDKYCNFSWIKNRSTGHWQLCSGAALKMTLSNNLSLSHIAQVPALAAAPPRLVSGVFSISSWLFVDRSSIAPQTIELTMRIANESINQGMIF